MDIVVARCAGLDVHKDTVVACVRTPGPDGQRTEQVRTFGTTTAELLPKQHWKHCGLPEKPTACATSSAFTKYVRCWNLGGIALP
jgi:hypothetical protein